ncbi:MAG: DUF3413 domain-containing protein [Chitinispirillaceae bacterium]|nr:DUF3413 domain-containing protein [Chitinispirillaceae bacterium]
MPSVDVLKKWISSRERPVLLRWSWGFFTFATLLLLTVGLRYLTAYPFPREPPAIAYVVFAFTSHFASIMLIVWTGLILPLTVLIPLRKFIVPASILVVSSIVALVLLDSQVYTAHRFHFSLLTIRILGWKTWGFGILYVVILLAFNSFLARIVWTRHIVLRKKLYLAATLPAVIVMLLATHAVHIWADATGYVPVTGFTTTLPMFYPSTDKRHMVKWGLADIANRRGAPGREGGRRVFRYPLAPLTFTPSTRFNILIVGVDAMRSDILTDEAAPRCMRFARESAAVFTNHWSGGNSTKMGLFSLFYGIPPTYQQYIESNKHTPILIDRLLEEHYQTGIFTSYNLYRPAGLDVTAFAKIRDLRLETNIPGPKLSYRNDSAITEEWKEWLDNKAPGRPFFGFLFYDALCNRTFPASYEKRVPDADGTSEQQKLFNRYKVSMLHIDSLIGAVLDDLDRRRLLDSTIVIITADHGNEFDDNHLGITGHGSAFSDYQLRVPLAVHWPGRPAGVFTKRTSHNDIVATLIGGALGCDNPPEHYSSGNDLYSEKQWEWMIAGSYYNFAIIEPHRVTVQFPGGYYEVRDHAYRLLKKAPPSPNIAAALGEMGKYFKK